MSNRVLRAAVLETLRSKLGLSEVDSGIHQAAQPPAMAPGIYYAVHPGGVQGGGYDDSVELVYSVSVTISIRAGMTPNERWGVKVLDAEHGCEFLMMQVVSAIANQWSVVRLASDLLNATERPGPRSQFASRLSLTGIALPEDRGISWWRGGAPGGGGTPAGLSMTATFGDCRRVISTLEPEDLV